MTDELIADVFAVFGSTLVHPLAAGSAFIAGMFARNWGGVAVAASAPVIVALAAETWRLGLDQFLEALAWPRWPDLVVIGIFYAVGAVWSVAGRLGRSSASRALRRWRADA